jgi:hypothetical protein
VANRRGRCVARDPGRVFAGHDGWVRWPQDVNVALKRLCGLADVVSEAAAVMDRLYPGGGGQ